MATAGRWEDLKASLDGEIVRALEALGYPTMTPCQAAAIPPLLQHQDVAVDAETGSGKTLSFLVPIAQLLLYARGTRCRRASPAVRALVIVPTRELAAQVHAAAAALFARLPGSIVPVPLIGGESTKNGPGPALEHRADTRLVIATPGRLSAALNAGALACRDLEILVLDEADRLLDMGFAVALTSILTRLPKQRRTGLYSATQTEQVDELARAGLRNPVRVAVRVKARAAAQDSEATIAATESAPARRRVVPATLTCLYEIVQHDHKLHRFAELLAQHPSDKFIVYLLTCACVDFFARLPLQRILEAACAARGVESAHERLVVPLHGKMSQVKRTRSLAKFASSENAVLVCTDVAARGLDIPDVDWIVQFDAPQDPDAYIHRVGRTARLGRQGMSLIYLAPSEDAYPSFLSVRRCPVMPYQEIDSGDGGRAAADMKTTEESRCRNSDVCARILELCKKSVMDDRAVLDCAEKAFLSYLRAYKEHKCSYILPMKSLNIGSVARSFCLLRLPRFQEFKKFRANLDFEKETAMRIRDIAYRDGVRERNRQLAIKDAEKNRRERRKALEAKSKKSKKAKKRKRRENEAADTQASAEQNAKNDAILLDEIDEEARLIKKVRRGKLSQEDFDSRAGYENVTSMTSEDDDAG